MSAQPVLRSTWADPDPDRIVIEKSEYAGILSGSPATPLMPCDLQNGAKLMKKIEKNGAKVCMIILRWPMHLYTGLHDGPVWSQTIRRHDYRSGFSGMIFFYASNYASKIPNRWNSNKFGIYFLKSFYSGSTITNQFNYFFLNPQSGFVSMLQSIPDSF